jgi:MYXO-CTERM domain-containing protein
LLEDGSVLVVGGLGEGGIPLATAELFKLFGNGTLCDQPADCQSGFCVDGVCCDRACDGGPCDVCSVHTETAPVGGQPAGVCQPVDSVKCDDGDLCTVKDTCGNGACKGMPVTCTAPDDCHEAGACEPTTGECSTAQPKNDGDTCNDGNDCTEQETCREGVCGEGTPVTCACPECEPYVCFGPSRTCKKECTSVNDCAPGYVCDRTRQCVDPPLDMHHEDNSDCSLAPSGATGGSPWPPVALSLLGLGALFARRRRAPGPPRRPCKIPSPGVA